MLQMKKLGQRGYKHLAKITGPGSGQSVVRTQLNLGHPLPLALSHVEVNGPSPGCNVHRRGAQSDWPRLQCLTRGLAHSGCTERERLGSWRPGPFRCCGKAGGALHRRLTLSDTPALLNRRPSAALRSVGSQRPQRGQTRFANSRAQEGAAGEARGLRLRGLGLRAAGWAGTKHGGQQAPSTSQRRAPRPPESGSRACTRTHAARERARRLPGLLMGGGAGAGAGTARTGSEVNTTT